MREFTIRSIVLGVFLALILGVANTWLGLYAGMTVSASIPAAVISMAILRGILKKGTILENNIVQSVASAGESLAAGVIFTVPAFLMIGAWQEFEFIPTTLIALCGGILGVVFMIPLRKTLMNDMPHLIYPEGQACAKVLEAGDGNSSGLKWILMAAFIGAFYKFASSMSGLMKSGLSFASRVYDRFIVSFSSDFSPALVAVGFIVQLPVAILLFGGGLLGSGVFLSISSWLDYPMTGDASQVAADLWSTRVRYMGVGAMLTGGIASLFEVIWKVRGGVFTKKNSTRSGLSTDRSDLSMWSLLSILLVALFGTFYLYNSLINHVGTTTIVMLILIPAAFLFVAVAAYTVGIVGSSNSPVSGMTICVLLLTAGVLLGLGIKADSIPMAILGVAGVVCCATATSGDIAQDLKTGQIVGAKPRLQQIAEIIGILATAPIFALTLQVLHNGPGIGTNLPGSLPAPQAGLFAALTSGILNDDMPYHYVFIGVAGALVVLVIDMILHRLKFPYRLHLMPIAVGIYLPMSVSFPVFIGGLIRYFCDRNKKDSDKGILIGSGLIAGEALTGITLALISSAGSFVLFKDVNGIFQTISGVLFFLVLAFGYYAILSHKKKTA